jgi:hypothetical protein
MRRVICLLAIGFVAGAVNVAHASPDPVTAPRAEVQQSQRPVGVRASTDQTVNVQKGMRIDMTGMSGCNGFVTVRTWDRDAVRVRATHSSRTSIQITPRDQVLVIRTDSRGPVNIDYELTVPEWIGFTAGSPFCSVDIDGLNGNVVVETVEGDIELKNVGGASTAKSIEGGVTVEGNRGRLQVSTIEGDIAIIKSAGEIVAESTEGNVVLKGIQASAVEVSTVEGNVTFEGTLVASGRYLFTSHEGDILLAIPENSNVTIAARTFSGGKLDSSIPLKNQTTAARGRRATYTLGNGSAQVDMETFEGSISVRRPGEAGPK